MSVNLESISNLPGSTAPAGKTAASVMNTSPRTCSRFSTVTEAVLIFKDEDCGLVPVVEDGKPIGVVTDRDVALSLADHADVANRPVSEIMKTDLVTIAPTASLDEIAQTCAQAGLRRLLVVDDNGMLVGVVSWSDIASYLPSGETGRMVTEVVNQP